MRFRDPWLVNRCSNEKTALKLHFTVIGKEVQ